MQYVQYVYIQIRNSIIMVRIKIYSINKKAKLVKQNLKIEQY